MTDFLIALFKMTHDQRANASPERAAARYGLPVEWCRDWIAHAITVGEQWPVKG